MVIFATFYDQKSAFDNISNFGSLINMWIVSDFIWKVYFSNIYPRTKYEILTKIDVWLLILTKMTD